MGLFCLPRPSPLADSAALHLRSFYSRDFDRAPDWLLNSHEALAAQIHAHVCAAGLPSAIGPVQSIWHIQ
jgi:hypothetical protein